MEIIYPDNFIKFFNDEEVDEVGEYEITLDDDEFAMIDAEFSNHYDNPRDNYNDYYDNNEYTTGYELKSNRSLFPFPPDFQESKWQEKKSLNPSIYKPTNYGPPTKKTGMHSPTLNIPNSEATLGSPPLYIPSKNDKGVQKLSTDLFGSGPQLKNVSPNSIRFCLYKFTYIWQCNGRSYWAYLINVDRRSVSGFRWVGWRWFYFGVDLRKIDSFICY